MRPQYTNQLVSSFLLYLDNKIVTKGEAFINVSGSFYPNDQIYNGYYIYSSPYNQILSDSSISGATVMTGVYVNNTIIGTGTSGLAAIDYNNGRLYFTSALPSDSTLSGHYSIKEYNIVLSDQPDENIIFENKYSPKPKFDQSFTGIYNNVIQYPAIFVKNNGVQNEPWTFGGQELTRNFIRLIVFSDSQFSNDAVNSILSDVKNSYVPLLEESEFPFNYLGSIKGDSFNYTGVTSSKILSNQAAFINEVFVARFNSAEYSQQLREVNPEAFVSVIDLETTKDRRPRA